MPVVLTVVRVVSCSLYRARRTRSICCCGIGHSGTDSGSRRAKRTIRVTAPCDTNLGFCWGGF